MSPKLVHRLHRLVTVLVILSLLFPINLIVATGAGAAPPMALQTRPQDSVTGSPIQAVETAVIPVAAAAPEQSDIASVTAPAQVQQAPIPEQESGDFKTVPDGMVNIVMAAGAPAIQLQPLPLSVQSAAGDSLAPVDVTFAPKYDPV